MSKQYFEQQKVYDTLIEFANAITDAEKSPSVAVREAANLLKSIPSSDVKEIVTCRYCKHHHWEQEPCHGKTEHFCSVLKAQVFPDFYCYHGKRKED